LACLSCAGELREFEADWKRRRHLWAQRPRGRGLSWNRQFNRRWTQMAKGLRPLATSPSRWSGCSWGCASRGDSYLRSS